MNPHRRAVSEGLHVASTACILCPEKRRTCSTTPLCRQAQWQSGLTSYQVRFTGQIRSVPANSVVLDEYIGWTDREQRAITDKFQVTEELLSL